ncbi:Nitrogen assimilation transcription factor [Lachnellula subtilissima]|uniref:Nitrogen assimilation transcription factor n=1 Tax=Lachnellula subtilissima TaxID=602034 RepID=A0A8H8S3F6_9HELO|nr:Nitrogen assimilation transcription factor [Lachnellula subtilissima]
MSFRKIRPSFGDSSASPSNPSQSTSESTGNSGSDPRLPLDAGSSSKSTSGNLSGSTASSKRRRVPESVTRNACLNCKKARAKCDGEKPCHRCASRIEFSDCVYEVHIKHAKEELVRQIRELEAKDHLTDQILQALSTDENVPEILERLRNGEGYSTIVKSLGRSPIEDLETTSPRTSHHSTFEGADHEMGGTSSSNKWTTVTSDSAVLDHLFQLYFAWVHPVHTLFSEGRFVDSYKRQSTKYCSSTLVNAICAMACHLHSVADSDERDFVQLGEDFSDAVRDDMSPEDKTITTVQAFAVMFLIDSARGKGLRASSYLRVATDSLSNVAYQTSDGFAEVWKNTVRGVQNLNVEWAQITFQVPVIVNYTASDTIEEDDSKLDEARWYFYRYVNDQCPAWPGLLATTNREKSKLIGIIRDMATMMYSQPDSKISARQILQQYSRFVAWQDDLPTSIGDIENNNSQALPHVLSLLILFKNSIIQLLRPLLDFEGFPTTVVEEVIWTHAQQGLYLIDQHYRTQYTCRYQPLLQMFSVLHLTDVVVRFFPGGMGGVAKDGPEAIQFAMEALMQSRAGFPVAGPLQELLRRTANECSIPLPRNLNDIMPLPRKPQQIYRLDDFIDACTRKTYTQPIEDIHAKYAPSFSTDWITEGPAHGFLASASGPSRLKIPSAEERGAQSLMQIHNLLNTN